tara:strand:+ start:2200 stop:4668 length:2469 start_codon:yes stop_codon:yes gene_type:complete
MKISYNWLKQYFLSECSSEAILEALPLMGFDVEETEVLGPPPMEQVVVGEVLDFEAHPNADRLRLCRVQTEEGAEAHSIICGAKNFVSGDRVMVALPGAVLPGNFKIKKSKLRGIESEGMLCSSKELNIGQDHDGILLLERSHPLGTPVNTVFPENDIIFHLEITPNRVDVLSHIGLARELAARFDGTVSLPNIAKVNEVNASHQANAILKSVQVEAPELCPEYSVLCIEGLVVAPSPPWLKSALESVGLRSINNVVDITNYVLHETGHPLHAFDAGKISGKALTVREANAGEIITTLDEKKHELAPSMLVIADTKKPLAIAGVMGSSDAEVDLQTQSIVLEAAYFKPSSVRMTARRLGISTDSSYRFERGVDPLGIQFAIERAAALILELAGGSILGSRSKIGSADSVANLSAIGFSPNAMRTFIGFSVEDALIESVFQSLNFSIERSDDSSDAFWKVSVPSYRQDLTRAVDLYEEFIRIYGTDKIPAQPIRAEGINELDHSIYTYNSSVGAYLTGKSFHETFLYTLRDGEEFEFFGGKADTDSLHLKLDNPLQSDQTHLRNSTIPGLLDVLELNHARHNERAQFFERGRVFRMINGGMLELISVGFVACAVQRERAWLQRSPIDFYTAKSYVEDLLSLLPFSHGGLKWTPIESSSFWQAAHSARGGNLSDCGYEAEVGLLNIKNIKARWGISEPVFAGSLLVIPDMFEKSSQRRRFQALSNQPASSKDLSLVVDSNVLASEVQEEVKRCIDSLIEGFACEAVSVFDVYAGDGLDAEKKSVSLSMRFRAQDRTLKDTEVNALFEAVQSKILEDTNYQIRKS